MIIISIVKYTHRSNLSGLLGWLHRWYTLSANRPPSRVAVASLCVYNFFHSTLGCNFHLQLSLLYPSNLFQFAIPASYKRYFEGKRRRPLEWEKGMWNSSIKRRIFKDSSFQNWWFNRIRGRNFSYLSSRSRLHAPAHEVLVPDRHVSSTSSCLSCFGWIYSDNRCYKRPYTVACWPSNDGCHALCSLDYPGGNNLWCGCLLHNM